jgi:ABC-type multidrug transport system ATPase subunit
MTPTPATQQFTRPAANDEPDVSGAHALEVKGLRRTFRATRRSPERQALAGLELTVQPGEWVSLLGPNGSGKSTLVRILAGSDAPQAGEIAIFGRQAGAEAGSRDRRLAAARLGVVFQKPGLDRLLTVRENLESQGALHGIGRRARLGRIAQLARQFGLLDRLEDRVATLSGGFQRRVDLARALLHEPDLLILDEATTGLDHQSRNAFLDLIAELRDGRADTRPLTILMTTHLMDEAERAQRVVMMADGAVVADGSPSALRSACGGRVLRVWAGEEIGSETLAVLLRQTGFATSRGETGELVGRGEPSLGVKPDVEQAVIELARLGVSFQVAPPDLGDAYLALAGRTLGHDAAEENR